MVGEEAEHDRAAQAADEVDRDDVERIVEPEACLDARARGSRRCPTANPMSSAGMVVDEPGARRDGDQAGDRARRAAERRGVPAAIRSISSQPSIAADAATNVFIMACAATPFAAERRAGVEAGPAEPEDAGADQRPWQRVRRHGLASVPSPGPDDQHDGRARRRRR